MKEYKAYSTFPLIPINIVGKESLEAAECVSSGFERSGVITKGKFNYNAS